VDLQERCGPRPVPVRDDLPVRSGRYSLRRRRVGTPGESPARRITPASTVSPPSLHRTLMGHAPRVDHAHGSFVGDQS
jgi:hypothetical protein